jgi:hypothetical protein
VAIEGAQGRLKAAAERRKRLYDQHVRDVPLREGQLVYLRNHGVRGRHKIQDRWSSVVYQIVRVPIDGGPVYAVAPTDPGSIALEHSFQEPLESDHTSHQEDP